MMKTILITAALPYANGPIHIGHLLEYIQADIFARHKKMLADTNVLYICADDAHGSAIMIEATKQSITPEELIARIHSEHESDLRHFDIDFDIYYSTHSPENQSTAEDLFSCLKDAGMIFEREIDQLYDESKGLFLSDRFVKGECPRCSAPDQYGDNCEKCGATYDASELKNPYSVYSNTKPILKSSRHYFLDLEKNRAFLEDFLKSKLQIQPELRNKLLEWFDEPLRAWDISRDAPYFGFKIPGEADKYFYVWLDAPVGYISTTKKLCADNGLSFPSIWQDKNSEIYHFIGKDIAYFHCLFWVNMLEKSPYRLPTGIFAHGFVNVNGEKMSKSKGNFIKASSLKHLDKSFIRYYLASKLNSSLDDVDFSQQNLVDTINSELIGKLINIASRTAKLLERHNDNVLENIDRSLLGEFLVAKSEVVSHYEARNYSKVCRLVSALADQANKYVNDRQPWKLEKDEATIVCSTAINIFHILICYLSPIAPSLYERSCEFLNKNVQKWDDLTLLDSHKISSFQPLASRIDISILSQQ